MRTQADLDAFTTQLAARGLDIVHPFAAAQLARELALPILDDPAAPTGLLVGSSRALWPAFVAARRADEALRRSLDPIDTYVEQTLAAAGAEPARTRFSHRPYDGAFLPFQRVAVAARLGVLSPSHLVIHPRFGPWFALRAIVLCEGPPAVTPAEPPTNACDCAARKCAAAFDRACDSSAWKEWLGVRETCCTGRSERYSDEQIRYHYVKDLSDLPE